VTVGKHQNLSIVLTMIASFTLTFAYLYWQRNMGRRVPVPLSQSVAAATPLSTLGERRARPLPEQSPNAAISPQTARVQTVSAAQATLSGGLDDPPLPVMFSLNTRPVVINDDEAPSRREIQNDGILLNSSDKRIAITVVEVNLPTMETTQAQLVLQPNGMMHFGQDWGLKMVSGDQLTLRAAGYQEITKTIP
jgi:hypothetical protein